MKVVEFFAGTQALKNATEKAKIPTMLCEHIVDICENGGEVYERT